MKVKLIHTCYVNDVLFPAGHENDWGDEIGLNLINIKYAVLCDGVETAANQSGTASTTTVNENGA